MPALKTRKELAELAQAMALNNSFVEYREHLFVPRDYETREIGLTTEDRLIWERMVPKEFRKFSNDEADILFATEAELSSFLYMVNQFSTSEEVAQNLLVPVKGEGVFALNDFGELVPPPSGFSPNALAFEYDPDVDTSFMWETLVGWLNSEEQAHSLLSQLSVGLQPSWTGSKYLLFIGEGSNGKSLLLKMLEAIIGRFNTSSESRQSMAAKRPTIMNLNGALMNIIFDGPREFVKDSSVEKTVIAGERLDIELKYANLSSTVQTNALFVEGLNREPKTGENTHALQRRFVRYHFPNKYDADRAFEAKMKSDEQLSALVKLIIEHWVHREDSAPQLEQTEESRILQLEQQWSSNPLMQYMESVAAKDHEVLSMMVRVNAEVDPLIEDFRGWLAENGYRTMEDSYLRQLVDDMFETGRKTIRINKKPTTRRVIKGHKPSAVMMLTTLIPEEVE